MRRLASTLAALAALGALAACATYTEDLNRGQHHYDANDYERALAIWRVLEPDLDSLSPTDRARYAYLRGMTDYRLGFRADARHWLARAKAIEVEVPGVLGEEWKTRLTDALADLNKEVYGGAEAPPEGAAEGDKAKGGGKPAPAPEPPKSDRSDRRGKP